VPGTADVLGGFGADRSEIGMALPQPSGRTVVGMLLGLALILVGYTLGSRAGGDDEVAGLSSSAETQASETDGAGGVASTDPAAPPDSSTDPAESVDSQSSKTSELPDQAADCQVPRGSVIQHDITLSSGSGCGLDEATIVGDISVEGGGALVLTGGAIQGDIQAQGADSVTLTGVEVHGDVQLEAGGSSSVVDTHVEGDLEWQRLTGQLVLQGSTIGGDVELVENTGVQFLENSVSGDIDCEANDPAPTGNDNAVSGEASGQCAGLG
jgi:hypothetical protein